MQEWRRKNPEKAAEIAHDRKRKSLISQASKKMNELLDWEGTAEEKAAAVKSLLEVFRGHLNEANKSFLLELAGAKSPALPPVCGGVRGVAVSVAAPAGSEPDGTTTTAAANSVAPLKQLVAKVCDISRIKESPWPCLEPTAAKLVMWPRGIPTPKGMPSTRRVCERCCAKARTIAGGAAPTIFLLVGHGEGGRVATVREVLAHGVVEVHRVVVGRLRAPPPR